MKRSNFQVRLTMGFVLAGFLTGCGAAPEPARRPPNLLFLSIDTLRADALGSYGGTWQATPFLDDFVAAGIRFDSAWSHTPKTAPSHMSMFTGLAPRVHGIGNQRSSGNQELSQEITTLAEALRSAGYQTGAVTSGGNVKGYLGFERGFEIYDDSPKNLPKKLADAGSWIQKAGLTEGESAPPWFFFFHTYAVHDPYLPPAKFSKRFVDPAYAGEIIGDSARLRKAVKLDDRAPWASYHQKSAENFWARVDPSDPKDLEHLHQLYMAGVASLDLRLKQFLLGLDAKGLLDNTIVVLTSDHGEEFGEHGQTRHDQLWQELLHVPLIVHLPGDPLQASAELGEQRKISGPVSHMDLAPSLIDLLGLDASDLFDQEFGGKSWAPWLFDASSEQLDRVIYSEHRSKLDRPLDLWALRQNEALVILSDAGGELRFIDRRADSKELRPKTADGLPGRLALDWGPAQRLIESRVHELGRLQSAAQTFGAGKGIQLDESTRAELEGLGYL